MPFGLGFFATAGASAASAGSFDLLETQVLGSNTASVTFSSLNDTYGTLYKHLQIRMTVRTTGTAGERSAIWVQFNGDSGSNYSRHVLANADPAGGVISAGSGSLSGGAEAAIGASALSAGNAFGVAVLDILDPFQTTKYKTVRTFTGLMGGGGDYYYQVGLKSGSWQNTAATTSLMIYNPDGNNLVTGSRFSLYGIKGA